MIDIINYLKSEGIDAVVESSKTGRGYRVIFDAMNRRINIMCKSSTTLTEFKEEVNNQHREHLEAQKRIHKGSYLYYEKRLNNNESIF